MSQNNSIVVGVDVGGERKGFHAVALHGKSIIGMKTDSNAASIFEWCQLHRAVAVGVDAPCAWSLTGRARSAERALMKEGIWCFATPTLEIAKAHPKNNFGWMLAGAELFGLLKMHYQLFDGQPKSKTTVCFETFPQAVTCALAGKVISAKRKSYERRKVLSQIGIDAASLPNIDFVDAALCAVAANYLLELNVNQFGDVSEGYIVVPRVKG